MDKFNVEIIENFLSDAEASNFFNLFSRLDFENIKLKFGNIEHIPKRKCYAFADPDVTYSFSGAQLTSHPWNDDILSLKRKVEDRCQTQFNYALLNLYPDGHAKINAHKDTILGESGAPIVSVSLGAARIMRYSHPGLPNVDFNANHGSIIIMKPPTNDFWRHSIIEDPTVDSARISVTFRRIVKKRPLQLDDLPHSDWFTKAVLSDEPFFKKDIGNGVFISVNYFRSKPYIHIRTYTVENRPTKAGVCMSPTTFFYLVRALGKFNFSSLHPTLSTVVNNSLILVCTPETLTFQEIWQRKGPFSLKPSCVCLNVEQILALKDFTEKVSEKTLELIVHVILTESGPQSVPSPRDLQYPCETLAATFHQNLCNMISAHYLCLGCSTDDLGQQNHTCISMSPKSKLRSLEGPYYLLVDLDKLCESNVIPPNKLTQIQPEKLISEIASLELFQAFEYYI